MRSLCEPHEDLRRIRPPTAANVDRVWREPIRQGEGQLDPESGSVPGRRLDRGAAVVGRRHRGDDREAQAGTPVRAVAHAGRIGPVEPLEDPTGVLGLDARALVAHLDDGHRARAYGRSHVCIRRRASCRAGDREGDVHRGASRRVLADVGQQVRHQLPQALLVTRHDHRAGRHVDRDRSVGLDGASIGHAVAGDGGQIHRLRLERPALVEPGEQQHVVDQLAHAHRLTLDPAHGIGEPGALGDRAGPVELGVAPDRGERGAQLVGRIGDEPAEPLLRRLALFEGALDLVEHAVEGESEPAGLGGRRADIDPPGEVALGDGVSRRRHLVDRPQPEADHPEGHEGQHHEHRRGRRHLHPDQPAQGRVGFAHRDADHDVATVGALLHRDPVAQARPTHRPHGVRAHGLTGGGGTRHRLVEIDRRGRITVAQRRRDIVQHRPVAGQLHEEELGDADVRTVVGRGDPAAGDGPLTGAVRRAGRAGARVAGEPADRALEATVDLVDQRALDVDGQHEVGTDQHHGDGHEPQEESGSQRHQGFRRA